MHAWHRLCVCVRLTTSIPFSVLLSSSVVWSRAMFWSQLTLLQLSPLSSVRAHSTHPHRALCLCVCVPFLMNRFWSEGRSFGWRSTWFSSGACARKESVCVKRQESRRCESKTKVITRNKELRSASEQQDAQTHQSWLGTHRNSALYEKNFELDRQQRTSLSSFIYIRIANIIGPATAAVGSEGKDTQRRWRIERAKKDDGDGGEKKTIIIASVHRGKNVGDGDCRHKHTHIASQTSPLTCDGLQHLGERKTKKHTHSDGVWRREKKKETSVFCSRKERRQRRWRIEWRDRDGDNNKAAVSHQTSTAAASVHSLWPSSEAKDDD